MNDDADLVARVRRGDRQAFNDLYNRYADDVFSMCLLILGDPTVARAAAGTAFALVARTRLNPLSDPTRLRPWLLELARGSALAWSGSPQARSVPVPHGVSPEELLDGAVVPAPASLRAGLQRTFDRAAVTAGAAAAAASRRAAERAETDRGRGWEVPEQSTAGAGSLFSHDATGSGPAAHAAFTASVQAGQAPAASGYLPEDAVTIISPSTGFPADRSNEQVPAAGGESTDDHGNVLPLMAVDRAVPAGAVGGNGSGEFRARPTIAVAAALAIAVAGLTAVISWPSGSSELVADTSPGIIAVTPSLPAGPVSVVQPPAAPATVGPPPTVAGVYTSRPAVARPNQVQEVGSGNRRGSKPRATSGPAPAPPPAPAPAPQPGPVEPPPGPTTAPTTPPGTGQPTTPPAPGTPPTGVPTQPPTTSPTTPDAGGPVPPTTPPAVPPTSSGPTAPPSSPPASAEAPTSPPAEPGPSTSVPQLPFPFPWPADGQPFSV